jgi:TonB-dependent starch-binding outer membrane protein SusC
MKSDVYNLSKLNTLAKKVLFLTGILFLSVTFTLTAQEAFNFSGMVQGENGEPLPGVNVVEKGTTNGTISGIDGAFQINLNKQNILFVFSMIGYETIEKELKANVKEIIVLKESVVGLSEILVVGYGIQKRSNITGAIAKLGNKEIAQLPTTNVNEALQGRIAGVNVTTTSGSPGAGQKVVIRGVATNGNVQPLYVVDGMATSNIDNLEPNDVESVTVLKDAASAAIYGAEAANGVVLITTKSGAKGPGKVEYSFQVGSQSIGDYTQPMDASSYATWINEANVGVTIPTNSSINTNWMDETLNTAMLQRHHLAFSGATEKGNYYVSGGYMNQDGVIGGDKSHYERFTLRTNITQQIKPWIKVGTNVNYTHMQRNSITEDSEFGGIISSALMLDPLTPVIYDGALPEFAQNVLNGGNTLVQNSDGFYYGLSPYVKGEIANPLAMIEIAKGGTKEDKFMGNMYLTLGDESWKGFKFTTRTSADVANQLFHTWFPTYWFSSERMNTQANVRDNTNTWFTWMWENYVSYDKSFGIKHNISAVAGISAKQSTHKYINTQSGPMFAEGDNFAQHGGVEIAGRVSGNLRDTRTSSYFARASYDYDGKYLVNAIFRRDGTSLLHPDQRWGNFPSVSAGWILSKEEFWNVDFIDFFKVRASWGTNGNLSGLGPDQFRSLIISAGIQYPKPGGGFYTGAEPELLANPELTWATSEQIDLGFDMNMLGDKLSVGFDYFHKKTRDLLVPGTPPPSVGNNAPFVNAGDVTNKGVELELVYRNYDRAVKYDISTNFTWLNNEVTFLNPLLDRVGGTSIGTGWTATYLELNQPVWFFRGYKTDGIFQNQAQIDAYKADNGGLAGYNPVPGDPIVVNTNGDNLINNEDQTSIGSPHPKFMWGTYLNFSYSGFDMRLFLQGVHGQDVLLGWNRYDRSTSNRPQFFFDERWTGEGSTNERPRADQSSPYIYNSDLMVFKGSYVKIRQIQLGYTVPVKLMKNNIQNLRLSLSLDEFFTFTNYPGMDPVTGSGNDNGQGIDRGFYPSPRKVLFGLTLAF